MPNEMRYEILYDDSFESQVEERETNPLLYLRIEVNGEEIKGAAPAESHLDDFMGMHIVKLLDSIPKLQRGETVRFHFYSHSQILLMEPRNGVITLACAVPMEIDNIPENDKLVVQTDSFVREVLRAAEEFVSKVVAVDDSLSDDDRIQEIERRVSEIRETL